MRFNKLLFSILVGMFCFSLSGCKHNNNEEAGQPVTIKKIPGSPFNYVTLTDESVKRVGIQIVPLQVGAQQNTPQKLIIPYSAIIYGLHGETWIYTQVKPKVFVRAPVDVDQIEGQFVSLKSAPPNISNIVSVGATELYGSEYLGNIQP